MQSNPTTVILSIPIGITLNARVTLHMDVTLPYFLNLLPRHIGQDALSGGKDIISNLIVY